MRGKVGPKEISVKRLATDSRERKQISGEWGTPGGIGDQTVIEEVHSEKLGLCTWESAATQLAFAVDLEIGLRKMTERRDFRSVDSLRSRSRPAKSPRRRLTNRRIAARIRSPLGTGSGPDRFPRVTIRDRQGKQTGRNLSNLAESSPSDGDGALHASRRPSRPIRRGG